MTAFAILTDVQPVRIVPMPLQRGETFDPDTTCVRVPSFRVDLVQTFYPSSMSLATAMYYGEKNPLKRVSYKSPRIYTAKTLDQRRLQKAFLRYHDQKNWPFLRQALRDMNRSDLIDSQKHQLVPEDDHKGSQRFGQRVNSMQRARGEK